MFKKDRVFYKNEDYTVRMEKIGGCEHYYIKFHGQSDSPEHEITIDIFKLYFKEFRKPFDKMLNEQRRHMEDGEADSFIISGKLTVALLEQEYADKAELQAALKTCTPVQQRRFELHYIQGYLIEEIAEMENCDRTSVNHSIIETRKKIKKYFLG